MRRASFRGMEQTRDKILAHRKEKVAEGFSRASARVTK